MLLTVLVGLPVLAGLGVWASGDDRPRLGAALAVGSLATSLALAGATVLTRPEASLRWSDELTLRLVVADVARAPLVLVAFVGLAVTVYALGYGGSSGRARLVGLLVAFVGVMALLLLAADLLTLLMAWELVGAVSWALIGHDRRGGAPAQATHAFLATRAGDLGLVLAAGAALAATDSLSLDGLGDAAGAPAHVLAAGVLVAAAAKSAQLPFAPWLFSAMAGPTPVSALLHSATMVAAGAYAIARVGPELSGVAWFGSAAIALGVATALAGGVVAAVQPDAKRLLAASTSANYGLMFAAAGAGFPAVAIAHLVAHGLFKALLFVAAGVAIAASGSERLAALRVDARLPVVAVLSAIGAAALAGAPPLGGAWTKEQVVAAAGHEAAWLALAVVAAGALSAFAAARFQFLAFGLPGPGWQDAPPRATSARQNGGPATAGGPADGTVGSTAGGAGAHALVALGSLAGATAALGALWWPWGHARLLEVTGGGLPAGAPWETAASLVAAGAAVYAAVLLARRQRLATPVAAAAAGTSAAWLGLPAATRAAVVDPVLALADSAGRFDDRVVDAGTRGAAGLAARLSSTLAGADDRVVDAGVRGTARLGSWAARALDRVGECGIDGAVAGLAQLAGAAGRDGRRLQTGQAHHYYAGIAAGLAVLVAVTLLWK